LYCAISISHKRLARWCTRSECWGQALKPWIS
jgi:hypothetical protein